MRKLFEGSYLQNFKMKIEVTIIYKDEKKEKFLCVDFPYIADWVTIFEENLSRTVIPRDKISEINYRVIK